MNPVNSYLGPLLEEVYRVLIERGYLRIVYGGVEEGNYLVHHDTVDERELVSLQVDPAWQRRGVGRKLVEEVAKSLVQEGESRLSVRVLADNPNQTFYESLGGRLIGSQPYVWEGYPTEELIFVWDDLRPLYDPA